MRQPPPLSLNIDVYDSISFILIDNKTEVKYRIELSKIHRLSLHSGLISHLQK